MNRDERLQAIYLRDDPLPEGPPPAGRKRASICIDIREAGQVAQAEQWMLANADALTVIQSTGCGCCVIGWDIEGPAALIDALPPELGAGPDWPRDYSRRDPGAVSRARSLLRRLLRGAS